MWRAKQTGSMRPAFCLWIHALLSLRQAAALARQSGGADDQEFQGDGSHGGFKGNGN